MGKTTKTSKLKVVFAVFQMVVFVVTMLYADAFGSANEQPVNTNSVFLGTESDQVGINPDNVNIDISSDDDKSSIITYNVQKGDTLESISQEFGVTVAELKKINKLSGDISAGQKLIVSDNEDGILYVVQEAKTLKLFAEYYRLNLQDLITLNYFSDESEVLYPGQEIFINVSEQRAYEIGLLQREQPQPLKMSFQ
ncbi:MAG: LysM peptidoglycan-binding domain-containing protein [candidate division SR1 bacterium]|nr:LysM peptidoglycan-binding domain-containing protein [candidate division SR1 bacterium]